MGRQNRCKDLYGALFLGNYGVKTAILSRRRGDWFRVRFGVARMERRERRTVSLAHLLVKGADGVKHSVNRCPPVEDDGRLAFCLFYVSVHKVR